MKDGQLFVGALGFFFVVFGFLFYRAVTKIGPTSFRWGELTDGEQRAGSWETDFR